MATDMTASGSPEEKLRWAFKMYDKDGSGTSTCLHKDGSGASTC
jgi:Ca2+-binding EF-hand superfamily protein